MDDLRAQKERVYRQMSYYSQTGAYVTGRVRHTRKNKQDHFEYGFITPDDPLLDDVFVYWRQVEPWREGFKELKVGDLVKFRIAKGSQENKWQAIDVEVARQPVDQSKFSRLTQEGISEA